MLYIYIRLNSTQFCNPNTIEKKINIFRLKNTGLTTSSYLSYNVKNVCLLKCFHSYLKYHDKYIVHKPCKIYRHYCFLSLELYQRNES